MDATSGLLTRWTGSRRATGGWAPLALFLGLLTAVPIPVAAAGGRTAVASAACGAGVSLADARSEPLAELDDPTPAVTPAQQEPVAPAAVVGTASSARSFATTANSTPVHLTPFQAGVAFSAVDSARGRELWFADATSARRLKDINPGEASSAPRSFAVYRGRLYFTAVDGTHGRELWRTDGTTDGTRMVKDIRPGTKGSDPGSLYVFEGRLYLVADDGIHGGELWRSDGTAAGTKLFRDIATDGGAMYGEYEGAPGWAEMGGHLYFTARRQYGELWRTDGTSAGTKRVMGRILPDRIVATASRLYFLGSHDDGGCALDGPFLFTSDGTSAGTRLVKAAEFPWGDLVVWKGRAWFGSFFETSQGYVSSRQRLWRSNGSEAGTAEVRPRIVMDEYGPIKISGGRMFVAIGGGVAISDGTEAGTLPLGDTGDGWRGTVDVVSVGGRWFFPAGQGSMRELWRSDGTPAGTRLALDVNPLGNGGVTALVVSGGAVWFTGLDALHGRRLWRYVP